MGLSQEIQRRIRNKEAEILGLERQFLDLRMRIESAKAYIQGLQDILPKAEREDNGGGAKAMELRPGTLLAQAREALLAAGKPLHVGDVLLAMNKENTPQARLSLGGSLARAVRDNSIFTRPGPNTFGLLEFPDPPAAQANDEELPEGFGE